MKVRAINSTTGDWTFGAGLSNYLQANLAISQNIKTRLSQIVGNCFFDLTAGIDWFNLLGAKDFLKLNLAISSVIIQTPGVTGIKQLSTNFDPETRNYQVAYSVQTIFSVVNGSFVFDKQIGG
jgi:hypothetical protein